MRLGERKIISATFAEIIRLFAACLRGAPAGISDYILISFNKIQGNDGGAGRLKPPPPPTAINRKQAHRRDLRSNETMRPTPLTARARLKPVLARTMCSDWI
jgi:hypothetical protein